MVCQFQPGARAQYLDNRGTEFIMGFLPNYDGSGVRQLHVTGDTPTSVQVEYPLGTVLGNYAVAPGSITIVPLPNAVSEGWAANAVRPNAVRAVADQEFVCYLINIAPYTSDAALGLPVNTMNTEYFTADYKGVGMAAHFCVVAAYDNTTVTITPSRDLLGHAAGVPFSVVLNRGEGYLGESGTADGNTGTLVIADRPVGVTNGDKCTNIPPGYGYCDHIFEVAQPTQTWGKEIAVMCLPNRDLTTYRIMASLDNTTISEDGVVLGVLNRGQFMERTVGGNHLYTADHPIFIWQLMTGRTYTGGHGTGDPAMGNMIPAAQYLQAYTFSTVGGTQFAEHWLTVIAETVDAASDDVLLDGVPIPAATFSVIPGSTLSGATIRLSEGTHSTVSRGVHGITVEGYNRDDSYLYPGGARFQFINPVGDKNPPVCSSVAESSTCWAGTGVDNRPTEDADGNGVLDPGEDLNGNGLIDRDTGVYLVQLAPGSVNLTLVVTSFIPGDPQVSYQVCVTDDTQAASGAVVVTDGGGNSCASEFSYDVECSSPTATCVPSQKVSNSSKYYRELNATAGCAKYTCADLKLYVGDTATPGFVIGPFACGDVVRINRGVVARERPGAYGVARIITVKGQATVWAVQADGQTSAVVACP